MADQPKDRPFDTSLWARPGIPMPDATARPRRWYHDAIILAVIFYLGFVVGRVG